MKRTTATITTLAVGISLGAAAGTVFALWDDDDAISAEVGIGYVHYAVGNGPDAAIPTGKDGAPAWQLPEHVLTDLAPGEPQTAVVQVDGYSQGNRGLEYWLAGLDVDGDSGFIDATDVRIVEINSPDQCVAGGLDTLAARYSGPSAGASFGDHELVHPRQFHEPDYGTWEEDSVTEYLCLELSLPDEPPVYTNTVTAIGTGQEASEEATVSDTDSWSAVLEPTAAQREAVVTLTFPYATYRPGGADDAGSSASTP